MVPTKVKWSTSDLNIIRERAKHMEAEGTVDSEVLAKLVERKLFKLFVPKQLGGLMATLPEAVEQFEESAWLDGSIGWTVTIGAGGGFFVPFLPPQTAMELFTPADAVIAGSGMPSGTAKAVEGGYIVSGTWRYCSGSRHATFFTANAVIDDGHATPDSPTIKAFAMLPEQVRIVPDWNAFGLKATDSHSIEVAEAFVPNDRCFSLLQPYETYKHAIYEYPFAAFAAVSFAAVTLGIGRHFLDEAEQLLEQNRISWDESKPGRTAFMDVLISEGRCAYMEANRSYRFHVERSWQELMEQGAVSEELANECILQSKSAAQAMRQMADSILPYLGMGAIMQHSTINQIWRDLHTACQHSSLISYP